MGRITPCAYNSQADIIKNKRISIIWENCYYFVLVGGFVYAHGKTYLPSVYSILHLPLNYLIIIIITRFLY